MAAAAAADAPLGRLLADVRPAIAALGDLSLATNVTRVHGDYHLGQLLNVEDGFLVVDFEGEPERPLAERRRPHSPLKDVAGMLRSLDYAGRTAARRAELADPDATRFADAWWDASRHAFLSEYASVSGTPMEPALLRAFEVEKACYEVAYEAGNRPGWLWLPLAGLERLLASPA